MSSSPGFPNSESFPQNTVFLAFFQFLSNSLHYLFLYLTKQNLTLILLPLRFVVLAGQSSCIEYLYPAGTERVSTSVSRGYRPLVVISLPLTTATLPSKKEPLEDNVNQDLNTGFRWEQSPSPKRAHLPVSKATTFPVRVAFNQNAFESAEEKITHWVARIAKLMEERALELNCEDLQCILSFWRGSGRLL